MTIPKSLVALVRQRAQFRCEYCHYPELLSTAPRWSEHFIWTADGRRIIGTTAIGRATCNRLDLNDERREEQFIQNARQKWLESGLHPLEDDPK